MNKELRKKIVSQIPDFSNNNFTFDGDLYTFGGEALGTQEGKEKRERTCLNTLKKLIINSSLEERNEDYVLLVNPRIFKILHELIGDSIKIIPTSYLTELVESKENIKVFKKDSLAVVLAEAENEFN